MMMKKAAPDTRSVLRICLAVILLAAGCGGSNSNGNKDSNDITVISVEKEGAVTLSIDWRSDLSDTESDSSSEINSDCSQLGITKITCNVYNPSDVLLKASDLGQCPSSQSTIDAITPGKNLTIVCTGADAEGNITHTGQVGGIKVSSGQTTNAGILTAYPFSTTATTPEDGVSVTANSTAFNWNSVPNASEYQIMVAPDPEFENLVIDEMTTQTTYLPTLLLPDTTYYWKIVPVDRFGNWGEESTYLQCTTEQNTACRAPILDLIGSQAVEAGAAIDFTIRATDPDSNDTLTMSSSPLPEGAVFDAATGEFIWQTTAQDAGFYQIKFTACDNCSDGGLCDSEKVSIKVGDICAPPDLAPIGPRKVAIDELLSFTISTTGSDSSDALTYTAEDLPTGAQFDTATGTFSWVPTQGEEGNYKVIFKACNGCEDGTACDVEEVTITVGEDTCRPPELMEIGPQQIVEGQELNMFINAIDPDPDSQLTYQVSGLPTGAQFNHYAWGQEFSWRPLDEDAGNYTLRFEVCDDCAQGTLCDSETVNITVGESTCRPPELVPMGSKQAQVGTALELSLSAADPDGNTDSLSYSASEPFDQYLDSSTGSFRWIPTSQDANMTYTISFEVCDNCNAGALCDTQEVTVSVGDSDCRPPVLEPIGDRYVQMGDVMEFRINANDADTTSVLDYSGTEIDGTGTFDPQTQTFTWQPALGDMVSSTIRFEVCDDCESGVLCDEEVVTVRAFLPIDYYTGFWSGQSDMQFNDENITSLQIEYSDASQSRLTIHPLTQCDDGTCDWGAAPAEFNSDNGVLTAVFELEWGTSTLHIIRNALDQDYIMVREYRQYNDGSDDSNNSYPLFN